MPPPLVLIPVKSLADGKSRLAGVLAPQDRRALNEDLLRRSLHVAVDCAGTSNCALVSHCEEALGLARALGVRGIRHSGIGGLDAAVEWGVREIRSRCDGDVLVMSSDMPGVCVSDLRAMAQLGAANGCVVIGTDRHETGTNLVFIPAGLQLRFSYGARSLGRHLEEGLRVAGGALVYRSEGVGFDIDTPDDLQAWHAGPAQHPPCTNRLGSPLALPRTRRRAGSPDTCTRTTLTDAEPLRHALPTPHRT